MLYMLYTYAVCIITRYIPINLEEMYGVSFYLCLGHYAPYPTNMEVDRDVHRSGAVGLSRVPADDQ